MAGTLGSLRLVTHWPAERPVAAFLLLSFGLSYLIGFPALMAYSAWAPPQPRVLPTYASRLFVVYGPRLRATLLTAAAWGLWHGPLLLSNPLTTSLFLFAVLGLSFLYTWIWAHSGERLFLVVLAHAIVNTPMFFWEEVAAADSNADAALSAWNVLEVMYAVAGCGLVLTTWRWWVQRPHTAAAQAQSSVQGRSPE